jgi:hypothetical protein
MKLEQRNNIMYVLIPQKAQHHWIGSIEPPEGLTLLNQVYWTFWRPAIVNQVYWTPRRPKIPESVLLNPWRPTITVSGLLNSQMDYHPCLGFFFFKPLLARRPTVPESGLLTPEGLTSRNQFYVPLDHFIVGSWTISTLANVIFHFGVTLFISCIAETCAKMFILQFTKFLIYQIHSELRFITIEPQLFQNFLQCTRAVQ